MSTKVKEFVDGIIKRIIEFDTDERPDELKIQDGLKMWKEYCDFVEGDPDLEEEVTWELIRRIDSHPRVTLLVTEVLKFGIQNLITNLREHKREEGEKTG